ncbi:MAG: DNA cytosine methyltransferase [Giesbergeria sp.]
MRYLSLFSGIEACSVAWAPLGWECVAVAEIEPWPSRVLAHHYPGVPNLGDVTKVTEEQIAMLGRIDVVVFGSPCQDLSVAGKRKGLDGARSGLFFTAMRIVGWVRQWCDCRFALWENVPGAFSSNKGRDFAAVVDAMAGLEGTGVPPKGWGTEGCALGSEAMVEWSTLDAQWFGVAQRRRRVFALADFGDWRNRPPILLEPESVRGDTAPRREAGQDVAGTLASRTRGGGFPGSDEACSGYVRPVLSASTGDVSHCLNTCGMGRIDYETETMIVTSEVVSPTLMSGSTSPAAHGKKNGTDREALVMHLPAIAFNSNAQPDEMKFDEHVPAPLTCSQYSAVAIGFDILGTPASEVARATEVHTPLRARVPGQLENSTVTMVASGMRVRRLTPAECEKLQGFEPGYTAIPKAKDGPRYKALGNSMAVPVMRWIGRYIDYAMIWSTP